MKKPGMKKRPAKARKHGRRLRRNAPFMSAAVENAIIRDTCAFTLGKLLLSFIPDDKLQEIIFTRVAEEGVPTDGKA